MQTENQILTREMAFQAHVEHYKAIREEIVLLNTIQNQLVNYSIAIIAGSISLFTFGSPSIAEQQPFVLLIVSLLMSAISLAFMEAEMRIHDRGRYLEEVLRKKIQKIIGNERKYEYKVFKWESADVEGFRLLFRGLAASGKFLIAYVPSVVYIFVFYFSSNFDMQNPDLGVKILFFGAAIGSLLLPVCVVLNVIFIFDYYKFLGKVIKSR